MRVPHAWSAMQGMRGLLLTPEGVLGSLLAVGTLTLGVVWAVDFVRASYEPAVVHVEAGGTAKLHGTFRSPWKETVTVKHVVAGCSCSQADVKPRRLEPGAVVEVDAVFSQMPVHLSHYTQRMATMRICYEYLATMSDCAEASQLVHQW